MFFMDSGNLWFWGTVPSDKACRDLPGIGRIRVGIGSWANRIKKYSNLVPGYPTWINFEFILPLKKIGLC